MIVTNSIEVVLPLPIDKTFNYAVSKDEFLNIYKGSRVVVSFGKKKLYTYPIPQGPSERTGDRLQIKCLQYEPPKTTNMSITTKNAFKRDPNTDELSLINMDDRRRLKNG